jgi:chemotaxis protein MotA
MDNLYNVISVVLGNLLGYDLLIFFFAAGALYCYLYARRLTNKLHKTLNHTVFLPEYVLNKTKIAPASELDLIDSRKQANGYYSVFINMTGIFPLLGILGTVIALIPMVSDIENMQQNFFVALTSTFWGLIFAIIFKFLDGLLSARIEENSNNIALYLQRNKEKLEEVS